MNGKYEILKNRIELGLKKPLKILHVTDSHIVAFDERDNAKKQELGQKRRAAYDLGEKDRCRNIYLHLADYAEKNCDLMVHTGDMIDFVSYRGCEVLKEMLDGRRYVFAVGNHEFSKYVGEAPETFDYKMQNYSKIQCVLRDNIDFCPHVIGGVNFITLDNSYRTFSYKQLQLLKAEVKRGYPIVLCGHNPIYHSECDAGIDENVLKYYCGYEPDETTSEFLEYIKNEPLVKLVLCGHIHENREYIPKTGYMQFMTGGTCNCYAREIEFI